MGGHASAPAAPTNAPNMIGQKREKKALEVDKLFRAMIKLNGSDLHLKVGKPATVRSRGDLQELNMPPITKEQMEQLLIPMMDERNLAIFYAEGGADFAYIVEHEGEPWRFRVNL